MLKEDEYEIVKTFKSRNGNIIEIAKLKKENTPEEIKDFYKFMINLALKYERLEVEDNGDNNYEWM